MKNKLLILFIAFIGVFNFSKAQNWVQIPDPVFGNYLLYNYPNAAMLSGGDYFIDADHVEITTETQIFNIDWGVTNLSGIEYFIGLEQFACTNNTISNIPSLPQSILQLWLSNNQLSNLPILPPNLLSLSCENNQLTSLPTLPLNLGGIFCEGNALTVLPDLPLSLVVLICSSNQLTSLPTLPPNLSTFECDNNYLNYLPALPTLLNNLDCQRNLLVNLPSLPSNLTFLNCSYNQISSLPILPQNLAYFYCDSNQLVLLPALPDSLYSFGCGFNQLTTLPLLPQGLVSFSCYFNQLISLPTLPPNLVDLYCSFNLLNNLPTLPLNLQFLYCDNNQLACIPFLPNSLNSIDLSNNAFSCITNYTSNPNLFLEQYPLCINGDPINNPNNCDQIAGVTGIVFDDFNNDCINVSSYQQSVPMQLADQNGTPLLYAPSTLYGSYLLPSTTGDYIVSVNQSLLTNGISVSCPPNNEIAVNLTAQTPSSSNNDFGLSCSGFDLGTHAVYTSGWIFPGQNHSATILAGDLSAALGMNCATGISGEINVSVSGPAAAISFPGSTNSTANSANYLISDFEGFLSDFIVQIQTVTTAQAGDEFCINVNVSTSNTNDLDPANNSYSYCYNVVNSYDPNIKLTTPDLVLPNYDDEFTYTIYFQNTGSAPAFNIRLEDVIDQNLDLSTFRPVAASHYYTTSVSLDTRNLIVRFPNIMLPDSTSNPEGSIGFIQYRIKPISNLSDGTTIENTAEIFFDFNPAIVTNSTINLFTQSADLIKNESPEILIYPNPVNDELYFSGSKIENVFVYDISGKEVLSEQLTVNKLNVESLDEGIYFINVKTEIGSFSQRFVVNR